MKISFLSAEIYSYNLCIFKELEEVYQHELTIFSWGLSPSSKIHQSFYNLNSKIINKPFSFINLLRSLINSKPEILVSSGWMDISYLFCCLYYRLKGIKVILIMDTQYNSISFYKKFFLIHIFRIFRKFFFTHAWIPGLPQYYLAVKLGFNQNNILTGLLTADCNIFNLKRFPKLNELHSNSINFLYVGRLVEDKGLKKLLDEWIIYSARFPNSVLNVVGDGIMRSMFSGISNVNIIGYLSPSKVAMQMRHADCFVLPSNYEPWGVVIHEAVSMGLPLICSRQCGATTEFLIHGFNGFIFDFNEFGTLSYMLQRFSMLSLEDRNTFSERSLLMSQRVTHKLSAKRFNEWIHNF